MGIELRAQIRALKKARVVCVGDVMLDRFVYGDVTRISPEGPIPICRVQKETAMLGGAGNVVRNLVALGASVDFISLVGNDDIARDVDRLLHDLSGVSHTLTMEANRPTTSKVRYVAGGQQLLRADRETTDPVPDAIADVLASKVENALRDAALLVVSDYGKGVITSRLATRLIEIARQKNKPVIVDPKSKDFEDYEWAALIHPNLREMVAAGGGEPITEDGIVSAARTLLSNVGIDAMLVTRGAQGMSLVSGDTAHHFKSRAREVFDVSGAGDTVVATLAASIAVGHSYEDAAQLANVAAGIVVGKVGTAVSYAEDILAELNGSFETGERQVVRTIDAAMNRIHKWRDKGEKVGFTNGCFDLLHPGHVSLLSEARGACDKLVVGLNSDWSVKRLKGEERPSQTEQARAAVLSSLETVDLVIIFSEDTPELLIKEIKPDVLVKGADYSIEAVIGADFVQSYGGEIILVEIVPGFSTTATIARMNS